MASLALLYVLAAASFYLGNRALITSWLWTRYPDWLDRQRSCPSCAGFWDTIALGFAFQAAGADLLLPAEPWAPLVLGAAGIVLVPLLTGLHAAAIHATGSTYESDSQ